MVAVANVRVNTQVPFPSMVVGGGPVSVTKTSGGVWTINLNGDVVASQNPGASTTDYALIWDSVNKIWVKVVLSNLLTVASQARTQRLATSSPITITAGPPADQIINVNISSGSPSCTLPSATSRGGLALTFKDVGANFGSHPLTVTTAGGDTIDGAASMVLNVNRQSVTIVPYNDGTTTGWGIE